MTKIHTLALAAQLAEGANGVSWSVAYTTPENYSDLAARQKAFGWRDVIVAPLADTAALFNEAKSRGLIIAGHEADRLIVALAEIEPSGGAIVVAESNRRPDLRYICERNNQKIVRQLTKMRASDWRKRRFNFDDVDRIEDAVLQEVAAARDGNAPVILFPFGPKSLVFLAGLFLAVHYPEAAWFVYPMPSSYDVDYTEGVDRTSWFLRDRLVNRPAAQTQTRD